MRQNPFCYVALLCLFSIPAFVESPDDSIASADAETYAPEDVNRDGKVDIGDILAIINAMKQNN